MTGPRPGNAHHLHDAAELARYKCGDLGIGTLEVLWAPVVPRPEWAASFPERNIPPFKKSDVIVMAWLPAFPGTELGPEGVKTAWRDGIVSVVPPGPSET